MSIYKTLYDSDPDPPDDDPIWCYLIYMALLSSAVAFFVHLGSPHAP